MFEKDFNKLGRTFVRFKDDLITEYKTANGDYPEQTYQKMLSEIKGTVVEIRKPIKSINREFCYSTTVDYEIGGSWNIYHYYIEEALSKKDYPELYL